MSAFRLRVRDDATGYGNYYADKRGQHMGWFEDRQEAEDVKRAMPNGDQFDVVEVEGQLARHPGPAERDQEKGAR